MFAYRNKGWNCLTLVWFITNSSIKGVHTKLNFLTFLTTWQILRWRARECVLGKKKIIKTFFESTKFFFQMPYLVINGRQMSTLSLLPISTSQNNIMKNTNNQGPRFTGFIKIFVYVNLLKACSISVYKAQSRGTILMPASLDDRDGTSRKRSQGSDYSQVSQFMAISSLTRGKERERVQPALHTYFCKKENTPRLQGANPPWGNFAKGVWSLLQKIWPNLACI